MAKKNSATQAATPVKKSANKIIIQAGTQIIKASFNTTKHIFSLYKEAGLGTFKIGKKLVKETLKLAIDNQKNVVNTSNQAFKETVEVIRQNRQAEKKTVNKKNPELSIDDLLNS